MGTVTTLPRSRALTVADLDAMPDDGHRYELIDGSLVVTPAPSLRHQRMSMALTRVLLEHLPDDLELLSAPTDVHLAADTGVQPDLLVSRRSDLVGRALTVAPLLAVEILSSSTRLIDLSLKKARYERAGVASYWVVDPDEPHLMAWELRNDRYAQVADVSTGAQWTATSPFDVTIAPGRLLG
jgi:Uma2 family endonuclease